MTSYRFQNFDTFDEFNDFDHGWDAEFRVSRAGEYHANIEHFVGEKTLITIAKFDKATVQHGTTPKGMRTFALPLDVEGPAIWLDQELKNSSVMLFPDTGDLSCVAGGPMTMASLSVDGSLFEQLTDSPDALGDARASALQSAQWQRLHRNLRLLISFGTRYGNSAEGKDWLPFMEEKLVNSFLASLPLEGNSGGVIAPSSAARTTRRAVDYVMSHLEQPFTISEMCREIACSRRTLEASFKRCYGGSPLQFIKFHRYSRCREALLKSNRSVETVTQVARKWGFWHMGQFSSEYRALFAEKPSSTLRRESHLV